MMLHNRSHVARQPGIAFGNHPENQTYLFQVAYFTY